MSLFKRWGNQSAYILINLLKSPQTASGRNEIQIWLSNFRPYIPKYNAIQYYKPYYFKSS